MIRVVSRGGLKLLERRGQRKKRCKPKKVKEEKEKKKKKKIGMSSVPALFVKDPGPLPSVAWQEI
jgi:hypothetical protein